MHPDKKYRIDRVFLIASAVIYIVLLILNFINLREHNYSNLIITIIPPLLLFVALRFPNMESSTTLAGIGTFATHCMLGMLIAKLFFEQIESDLQIQLFMIIEAISAVCGGINAARAVVWIREMREMEKSKDRADGSEQMKKRLGTFLRPAFYELLICAVPILASMYFCILDLRRIVLKNKEADGETALLIGVFLVLLLVFLYLIKKHMNDNQNVEALMDSRMSSQVAADFINGKGYCNGRIVLGSKYIFAKGSGRVYEYKNLVMIFHRWEHISGRRHWYISAVEKDGEKSNLIEVPYAHNKNCYNKYVLPMLNEIKMKNENIEIGDPHLLF